MEENSDLSGMPTAAKEQVMIAREIASQIAADQAESENSPQEEAREYGFDATEQEIDAAPDKGKIDPEDYKARYAALRNKRDEKIETLIAKEADREKELRAKAQRIADLEAALAKAPAQEGFKLPAALEYEFGDEARNALEQSINGYVGKNFTALQENIQSVGKSIIDSQKTEVNDSLQTIQHGKVGRILSAVSDMLNVDIGILDRDPQFINHMKSTVDEYSGRSRADLYKSAFLAGDARRMAELASSFLENKPQPRNLESKVMPSKANYGDAATGKGPKQWTKSGISEFYTRAQKGAYTPEQAAALKKDIMRAVNAHEVVDG